MNDANLSIVIECMSGGGMWHPVSEADAPFPEGQIVIWLR
jgi:hypothetical protein